MANSSVDPYEDAPLADPLGIEIFAIDETFESLFNSLIGVYFRLYFKESEKPLDRRNNAKAEQFHKRYKEMSWLKSSFPPKGWEQKKEAIETYSSELKKMNLLELTEYAA